MRAIFSNISGSIMADHLSAIANGDCELLDCEPTMQKNLDDDRYDDFCNNLLDEFPWLAGCQCCTVLNRDNGQSVVVLAENCKIVKVGVAG